MGAGPLLAALLRGGPDEVLSISGRALSADQLLQAATVIDGELGPTRRLAVWMTASLEAVVAVVAGLLSGREVVPLNPSAGPAELEHILSDSAPGVLVHGDRDVLPRLPGTPRLAVDANRGAAAGSPADVDLNATALILYTSGTTGPPKGVMLSQRAIAANLDALGAAWEWTKADVVVHALPLFHAHGLVLGTLGPLRLGGRSHHVGRFSAGGLAAALETGGTMLFAVPTMYHRLAAEAAADPALASALRGARLLVSGSAALAATDHELIRKMTGQQIVERYGLTETLMSCAVRCHGPRRPGSVGPPLEGVELRLLDDAGAVITARGADWPGEISVRGPSLFNGYLNNPAATRETMRDGWLLTGDVGVQEHDGSVRILGRKNLDMIKTGGFRVGAGEVEASLLEHPAVAEAAVLGEPDDDLGQAVVAWVVLEGGSTASAGELTDWVATNLAAHKRPRRVVFVERLPRNAMGKVVKKSLLG